MADYNEVLEYLKKASLRGSKLGLERTTELCERLGNPQEKTKIIHVAGTNGKGSFCAMLSAILHESGYKIGGFSSPALTEVTDSFRIDCEEISKEDFAEIMTDIIPLCEDMDDKPTEFEVLTAFAYKMFSHKNCDIAVVECGMGGDTDSTNIINSPLLSVITNIAIDHTAFLGDTIQEIASHKAGIIKHNSPVLYGGNNADALEIIIKTAEKTDSPLYVTEHSRLNVVKSDISGIKAVFDGTKKYSCSLVGEYQPYNIANVLTAVEILKNEGLNIPESAVEKGLAHTKIHGRFEVFSLNPPIIFDGSHNPDGIKQTADSIEKYFDTKVALLIGVMADKDYELYPKMLGKYIDRVYTVKPDNPRALDSTTLLLSFMKYGILGSTCDNSDTAMKTAIDYAMENNIPLIALGSLYMYKDFIRILTRYNLP
ncbi:MAG: bifunctional folylpolyglutamate synthase/dihydrofolate synthase [Ruminococcus sp.]|nr:bifunctional folylpolyglutamate synthase/dihydrofolate synthase [Ruminococcus sp.]